MEFGEWLLAFCRVLSIVLIVYIKKALVYRCAYAREIGSQNALLWSKSVIFFFFWSAIDKPRKDAPSPFLHPCITIQKGQDHVGYHSLGPVVFPVGLQAAILCSIMRVRLLSLLRDIKSGQLRMLALPVNQYEGQHVATCLFPHVLILITDCATNLWS